MSYAKICNIMSKVFVGIKNYFVFVGTNVIESRKTIIARSKNLKSRSR